MVSEIKEKAKKYLKKFLRRDPTEDEIFECLNGAGLLMINEINDHIEPEVMN